MATELQAKLERLQNRPTRYEVTATHRDYPSMLLGYTPRKTRPGLVDVLLQHSDKFVELTGTHSVEKDRKTFVTDTGWIIQFSGRTQRDAYCNGERPFIETLEKLDDLYF